jgi:hypothetical protein
MRTKLAPIIGGLLNCGIVTAVLWWMINSVWRVGGVGILQQTPWPLSSIYACTAVGTALGLGLGILAVFVRRDGSQDQCNAGNSGRRIPPTVQTSCPTC